MTEGLQNKQRKQTTKSENTRPQTTYKTVDALGSLLTLLGILTIILGALFSFSYLVDRYYADEVMFLTTLIASVFSGLGLIATGQLLRMFRELVLNSRKQNRLLEHHLKKQR